MILSITDDLYVTSVSGFSLSEGHVGISSASYSVIVNTTRACLFGSRSLPCELLPSDAYMYHANTLLHGKTDEVEVRSFVAGLRRSTVTSGLPLPPCPYFHYDPAVSIPDKGHAVNGTEVGLLQHT